MSLWIEEKAKFTAGLPKRCGKLPDRKRQRWLTCLSVSALSYLHIVMSLLRSLFGRTPTQETRSTPASQPLESQEDQQDRRKRQRVNARANTRVLIVDDSATIVAALEKTLVSAGYTTFQAFDAESAIEIARQEQPELIFLDIVLPGMNGFAALRQMRRDPLTRHIPIIMISGNEAATEQFYANRIGADDFMKKPFSRSEVFAKIEPLLDDDMVPRRRNFSPHEAPLSTQAPAPAATPAPTPAPTVSVTPSIAATSTPVVHPAAAPTAPGDAAIPPQPSSWSPAPAAAVPAAASPPISAAIPSPATGNAQPAIAPAGAPAMAPTATAPATPISAPAEAGSIPSASGAPLYNAPPPPAPPAPAPAQAAMATAPAAPASAPPSPPAAGSAYSPLEARKELTAMGLQYFDQAQFIAAIQRGDKLAFELFVAGGGVDIGAETNGKTPLQTAREHGRTQIFAMLRARLAVQKAEEEQMPPD